MGDGVDVTATLDRLGPDDVRPLARLHRRAFPGFFLSTLGEAFLVEFYRAFLTDPTAVTVVARTSDGGVHGAVVGTTQPAGFFGRLVRRRWLGFAAAAARSSVTRPRTVPRLVKALRYRGDAPTGADGALLSSICVQPSRRGSGLGRQLERAWLREVAARGVAAAYLTTDREGNDPVNEFYRSGGWVLVDGYTTREGRAMNRYVKKWDTL